MQFWELMTNQPTNLDLAALPGKTQSAQAREEVLELSWLEQFNFF